MHVTVCPDSKLFFLDSLMSHCILKTNKIYVSHNKTNKFKELAIFSSRLVSVAA